MPGAGAFIAFRVNRIDFRPGLIQTLQTYANALLAFKHSIKGVRFLESSIRRWYGRAFIAVINTAFIRSCRIYGSINGRIYEQVRIVYTSKLKGHVHATDKLRLKPAGSSNKSAIWQHPSWQGCLWWEGSHAMGGDERPQGRGRGLTLQGGG